MLRSEANASHEIAFRPLVDLSFPKMNGPLLASVPKKSLFQKRKLCIAVIVEGHLRDRARIFLK